MICGDDLRQKAERKTPANQLTSEERRTIIDTVNKPEYASKLDFFI